MLVLTRRTGQSILVGDDIVVTVLELSRDQVRIGIRAPRSVSVHREEVYQEILLSNQAAAGNVLEAVPGTVNGTGIDADVVAEIVIAAPSSLDELPRRPKPA